MIGLASHGGSADDSGVCGIVAFVSGGWGMGSRPAGAGSASLSTLASVSSMIVSAGVVTEVEAEETFFSLTFRSFSRIARCFGGGAGSEASMDTGPVSDFRFFFFSFFFG